MFVQSLIGQSWNLVKISTPYHTIMVSYTGCILSESGLAIVCKRVNRYENIYWKVHAPTKTGLHCLVNVFHANLIKTWPLRYILSMEFQLQINTNGYRGFRSYVFTHYGDKKEEIWPSPMIKAPTPTECHKGKVTTQRHKKFDYTAVADRLRTISWSKYSHPTGVVNLVYGPNLLTPRNSRVIKGTHI